MGRRATVLLDDNPFVPSQTPLRDALIFSLVLFSDPYVDVVLIASHRQKEEPHAHPS
jgi:hypothetical protein